MSPVFSQPSTIISLVAFSLFKYPFMMWGPLAHISPFWPATEISSFVAESTNRISQPAIFCPILDGFRLHESKQITGEVSVIPYPCEQRGGKKIKKENNSYLLRNFYNQGNIHRSFRRKKKFFSIKIPITLRKFQVIAAYLISFVKSLHIHLR